MLGIIKLYLIILFYDLYIVGGISLNRHRNSLFRNSLGFISSQYYNINRRNNSKSLSSKLDENNEFHSDEFEFTTDFNDYLKFMEASGYYISVVKNEPMKELYIRERITKYPLRIVVKDELNKIKGFDSLNPWTEIYAKGSLGFDRECRNDYFSGCYILIDSENPDHKLEFIYNSQNELKGSFASHDFHEDMNHKSSSYLHLVNLLNHLRDNKLILSKIEDELIGPDGDDSHIKDKKYKKKLNSDFKKRANACKTLIKIIDAMLQLRGANYKVVKENLYEIINEFRVLIKPTYFTPDWELQLK